MSRRVLYFAYGSNMLTARLQERVPAARAVGAARLANTIMVCNKRSIDGSGKANLRRMRGKNVWGVLFVIDDTDLAKLDKVEGGYRRVRRFVQTTDGNSKMVYTYISTKTDDRLKPYCDYKSVIIKGAREHKLPHSYIECLDDMRCASREWEG